MVVKPQRFFLFEKCLRIIYIHYVSSARDTMIPTASKWQVVQFKQMLMIFTFESFSENAIYKPLSRASRRLVKTKREGRRIEAAARVHLRKIANRMVEQCGRTVEISR